MAPAVHLQVGVGVGVGGTESDRESRARIESEVEPICQKIEWNYLLKWTHWDAKFSAKPVRERPTRFAGIEKKREKKEKKLKLSKIKSLWLFPSIEASSVFVRSIGREILLWWKVSAPWNYFNSRSILKIQIWFNFRLPLLIGSIGLYRLIIDQ